MMWNILELRWAQTSLLLFRWLLNKFQEMSIWKDGYMTRDKVLTKRWNNWLTFGFGLPTLIYAVIFLSTSAFSDFSGFIGMFILGALYWTVVEYHSAKRFAWERENATDSNPIKLNASSPINLIFVAYNIVYWVPIVLAFTHVIGYRTGFIAFFGIVVFRALANVIRNNYLTLEQAEVYPFRIP